MSTANVDENLKAIYRFNRKYPEVKIVSWGYVDIDTSFFDIRIKTDREILDVSFDPVTDDIKILSKEALNENTQGSEDFVPLSTLEKHEEVEKPAKVKGRKTGALALALTLLYALYIFSHFYEIGVATLAGFIASSIVMPHIICVVLATIFSFVGCFAWQRWAMLTSGILMTISAVLFTMYAPMVIVQAILFFISYARMGNNNNGG